MPGPASVREPLIRGRPEARRWSQGADGSRRLDAPAHGRYGPAMTSSTSRAQEHRDRLRGRPGDRRSLLLPRGRRLPDAAARSHRRRASRTPTATICSPSRYGRSRGRSWRGPGGSRAFEGPGGPSYVTPEDLTIAEVLQAAGYRTGIFGKWHLGDLVRRRGRRLGGGFENSLKIDYEKSCDGPQTMGFDESFVTPNCPTTDPLYLYIENEVPVPATDRRDSPAASGAGTTTRAGRPRDTGRRGPALPREGDRVRAGAS